MCEEPQIPAAAAKLREWYALSNKAQSIFLDNEGTPKGDKALRVSTKAFDRCRPLAEKIWSMPVRSWADVVARAYVLECFYSDGSCSAEQDRAAHELIAAIKIMGCVQ